MLAKHPRVRLTDPAFVYTPSYASDIRVRFARINAEIAASKQREQEQSASDAQAIQSIFSARQRKP